MAMMMQGSAQMILMMAYLIPSTIRVPHPSTSGAGFSPRNTFRQYPSRGIVRRSVAIRNSRYCFYLPTMASFA